MKKKSTITHNITIAAECPPMFDVADITTTVVDALTPMGIYPRDVSVNVNESIGVRDVLVVSAVMSIFGFGLAVGTLEIAGAIGNGIMSLAQKRKARTATIIYSEEEKQS